MDARITLRVDGEERSPTVDTRTTLLDALRDRLGVMSPKKGCDHGQCGACTVLVGGRRVLGCLALAVAYDGAEVVTARGLGALPDGGDGNGNGHSGSGSGSDGERQGPSDDGLHPVQRAFLDHDGLQCGYCTPGQVCSAVGMLAEAAAGHPSHVTDDLTRTGPAVLDDTEIRERMSGNLCRCGAYVNILAAVREQAAVREEAAPARGEAIP
ncbi:2Fe-2S iron-sulfur cluster-binding protein [Streptomyces sp. NPDC054784]